MAQITFLGNFNVDYTSETHHAKSLESLGHAVTKLQETQATATEIYEHAIKSNLFVWVHTHGWKTPEPGIKMKDVLADLKARGIPTITYHLDLWLGLSRQADLVKEAVYTDIEHFFTVDSKMADWFNTKTNVKGHYLPAGVFHEEATYSKKESCDNDIIFVGSRLYHREWRYRPKLIHWLKRSYPNRFKHYGRDGLGVVRGAALNDLYASTKIVVGDTLCPGYSYPDYWSDRIYETLGRGGFLIHPYIPGMDREFTDKEHVVFYKYGDFAQLKTLIDYYLVNDEEREAIRLAGHSLVKNNYTYRHRWQAILQELGIK
jgi:hypothetical protein